MRLKWMAIPMAIILLSGAAALTFAKRSANKDSIKVTAYFEKAIGLFPDSDVRVLGVAIGKVATVDPVGTKVKVVMEIEKDRKVPANARAAIIPISLISDRYIQLEPPYDSGPALQDGAVLGTEVTSIPAELDDVLSSLKKFLDAVQSGGAQHPGTLGLAVKNLSAALKGTGSNLDQTLGSAGKISEVVTSNAASLDSITVHLSNLLAALAHRQSEITTLNTRLAQSLGGLADDQAALDGALKNLALLTEQLGSLIQDHRLDLQDELDALSRTTQTVMRHQDSLIRANDWLHVVADGAEGSHNQGAVDTVNGPTVHIDVRDGHYGTCPFPSDAFACSTLFGQLPLGPIGAGSNRSGATGPTPISPEPRLNAPLIPPLELPAVPSLQTVSAETVRTLASPQTLERPGKKAHSFWRATTSWFESIGGWIARLLGDDR